jgi:precorrin-6B methylase 2
MNRWIQAFALLSILLAGCSDKSPDPIPIRVAGPGRGAADQIPDILFIPTPNDIVDRMLELASVRRDDVVYDLGCGDGRILVAAAKRYGCRCVGLDIDPLRIKESERNAKDNGVDALVRIEKRDLFTADLPDASVVFLYLSPKTNVRLLPQLEQLPPGSRIVSHQFDIQGLKPDKVVEVQSKGDSHVHTLFLWTTPLKQ